MSDLPAHPNPESQKSQAAETHAVIQRSEVTFSGPLPPPSVIKEYDAVVPGAADRIISMAEKQSAHRQSMETKLVDSDIRQSKYGVIFGFILGLVGLLGGALLVYSDKVITGSVFFGGTLVSLVGVFVLGSRRREADSEE